MKKFLIFLLLISISTHADPLTKINVETLVPADVTCNGDFKGKSPITFKLSKGYYKCSFTSDLTDKAEFDLVIKDEDSIKIEVALRLKHPGDAPRDYSKEISFFRFPRKKKPVVHHIPESKDYSTEAEAYLTANPLKADCLVKKLVELKNLNSDGSALLTASELADFKQSCH